MYDSKNTFMTESTLIATLFVNQITQNSISSPIIRTRTILVNKSNKRWNWLQMAKFAFLCNKRTINQKNVIENPLQHSTCDVIASD